MGYQVSSVLAVSPNDSHAFFVYYIPARTFRYHEIEWINNYIYRNFSKIASSIGPKGVIIAPTTGNVEDFIESVPDIHKYKYLFSQEQLYVNTEVGPEYYLHTGEPYLIITSTPLIDEEKTSGILINLNGIENKKQLGGMIGAIIEGIKRNSLDEIVKLVPEWSGLYHKNDISEYTALLELKPNIFGIGVNLNEVLDRINRNLLKKPPNKSIHTDAKKPRSLLARIFGAGDT